MIPKHPFRNLVLPAVILAPLIGVMVGCVYIPTFDHTILDGTKKDFRGWAKDHKNIAPYKLAAINRPQIDATCPPNEVIKTWTLNSAP